MSASNARARRVRLGIWLIIAPFVLLIGSLILYALSNWVLNGTGDASIVTTVINIILFVAGALAVALGLPSVIVGIVLLATQPAPKGTPTTQVATHYESVGQSRKGLSIAGMVLGICSLIFFLLGGFIMGVLAIIFSAIGLKRKAGVGMAVTGLVTGVIGVLVGIIVLIAVTISSYNGITERANDSATSSDAATVQKYAELFYANNGTYPDLQEIQQESTAKGETFIIGDQGSSQNIIYVPCYGEGAIIWYWSAASQTYETRYVGTTDTCELAEQA